MKLRFNRSMIVAGLVLIILTIDSSAQSDDAQKQVAAFKQAVQKSMAGLKKYEWVETTTVSFKGEVKSQKQNRCYYGADGKIQKVPIGNASPPQQEQSGRRGRIKSAIVANKKEELTEFMQAAVELVHKYIPPDPNLIQYSKQTGNLVVEHLDGGKAGRVTFINFLQVGDKLTATLNFAGGSIIDINVASYVKEPKDAVDVVVAFSNLLDGTNYAGRITLDAKSEHILVVVENTGHRPL